LALQSQVVSKESLQQDTDNSRETDQCGSAPVFTLWAILLSPGARQSHCIPCRLSA